MKLHKVLIVINVAYTISIFTWDHINNSKKLINIYNKFIIWTVWWLLILLPSSNTMPYRSDASCDIVDKTSSHTAGLLSTHHLRGLRYCRTSGNFWALYMGYLYLKRTCSILLENNFKNKGNNKIWFINFQTQDDNVKSFYNL